MGFSVVDGCARFCGPVDRASLKRQGWVFGPTQPLIGADGLQVQEDGRPVWTADVLDSPRPSAAAEMPAPSIIRKAPELPTIGDGVRAVFDRHFGAREVPQTGQKIPAPDPATSLNLLDMELQRRKDVIEGLKAELASTITAYNAMERSHTQAVWERDRALQDVAALRAKLEQPYAPKTEEVEALERAAGEVS